MDKGTFFILLLSGLCAFSLPLPRRHFHFIDILKNWKKAMSYCQENHKDMATVNDEQDLGELAGLVPPLYDFAHIGLQRGWIWSMSENDDHKEGEELFWAWAEGNPGGGECANIEPSGGWNSMGCDSRLNFSCYDGYVTDLSRRFMMGNGSLTWTEAQTYCRTHHTDLARIRNHNENTRLQAMAHDGQIWIGLAKQRWFWTDGSEPSFVPRVNAPPKYVEGNRGQLWLKKNPPGIIPGLGSEKRVFFCYSAPRKKHVLRLKLSAGSSVDLRDPAVTESIRQWVKTKLREKGVWKDVKLNWKEPQIKQQSEPPSPKHEETCVP